MPAISPACGRISPRRSSRAPEPSPALIGNLVLQIRERKAQIRGLQQQFVQSFAQELGQVQLQRLQRARQARELQPVLNALDAIGLI